MTEPPVDDLAILLAHAYDIVTHEGAFDPEDCTKCAAWKNSAEATQFLLASCVQQEPKP